VDDPYLNIYSKQASIDNDQEIQKIYPSQNLLQTLSKKRREPGSMNLPLNRSKELEHTAKFNRAGSEASSQDQETLSFDEQTNLLYNPENQFPNAEDSEDLRDEYCVNESANNLIDLSSRESDKDHHPYPGHRITFSKVPKQGRLIQGMLEKREKSLSQRKMMSLRRSKNLRKRSKFLSSDSIKAMSMSMRNSRLEEERKKGKQISRLQSKLRNYCSRLAEKKPSLEYNKAALLMLKRESDLGEPINLIYKNQSLRNSKEFKGADRRKSSLILYKHRNHKVNHCC
jgi:hypothetical protein